MSPLFRCRRVNHARVRARIFAVKREASRRIERVKVNDRSVCNEKFHPLLPLLNPLLPFPSLPFLRRRRQLLRARSKNPCRRKFVYERATGGIYIYTIRRSTGYITSGLRRLYKSVGEGVKGVRLCYVCASFLEYLKRGKVAVEILGRLFLSL